MPVPKNKPTTMSPEGSTSESSSDIAPEQEEECTPARRGYRNGSYTRDLVTPTGRMEALKV